MSDAEPDDSEAAADAAEEETNEVTLQEYLVHLITRSESLEAEARGLREDVAQLVAEIREQDGIVQQGSHGRWFIKEKHH